MKHILILLALVFSMAGTQARASTDFWPYSSLQPDYNIGWVFYFEENYEQAIHWFKEGAKKGHLKSQLILASMYYNGRDVTQNYEQAFYWTLKSAKQGHGQSQQVAGVMYGNGQGVEQSNILAYMWLNIAAAKGNTLGTLLYENKIAKRNRDAIAKEMSSKQVVKALRQSKRCVDSNYQDCGSKN